MTARTPGKFYASWMKLRIQRRVRERKQILRGIDQTDRTGRRSEALSAAPPPIDRVACG